uniref:chemerin-like receptor 1 n=1 Tax=Pristiophorus japonicus TaxID=55135 RepID=UPI00398F8433
MRVLDEDTIGEASQENIEIDMSGGNKCTADGFSRSWAESAAEMYGGMEPDDLQLTNSSEVPHETPATEGYSSLRHAMHAFTMAIFVVTCVLGLSGNGLVIWATGFKLKRTANTVWFLSLAVADFTFSLLLPLSIAHLALDFHWPFGRLLCQLNSGAAVLCMHASIFMLVTISVDRCVLVVLPVWSRNHRGPRLAALLSLGVWVAAAVLSAPSFAFRDTVSWGNRTLCYTEYLLEDEREALAAVDYGDEDHQAVIERLASLQHARYRGLTLARFLLGFLLPFLVIGTSYAVIGLRLRRGRLAPSSGKPFRVMAAIVLAFLLCWAPYQTFVLLELLHPPDEPWLHVLAVGIPLSSSLACINSCINPVLYISMGQGFRDKLRRSLSKALENAFQEDSTQFAKSGRAKTQSLLLCDEAGTSI